MTQIFTLLNFDDSVLFSELNNLSSFYKDVLSSFNKVFVTR